MENKPSDPIQGQQDSSAIDANNESHAFVIRIWLEDIENDNATALWRGHITHVLDQRRQYFQDLAGINHFITPYLEIS